MSSEAEEAAGSFSAWKPSEMLSSFSRLELELSRGFLRCKPESWFPGFGNRWLPLAHALSTSIKVTQVKPRTSFPKMSTGYMASIDDEPCAVALSDEHARALAELVLPGSRPVGEGVLMSYLASRLYSTLSATWIGDESTVMRYEPDLSFVDFRPAAAIEVELSLNDMPCSVWVLIGGIFARKLDALWKRRIRSESEEISSPENLQIELTQLAVPTPSLEEYLKPGTLVDLEVPLSDRGVLKVEGESFASVQLCTCEGKFAFRATDDSLPSSDIPEGSTRICVQIDLQIPKIDSLGELKQVDAALVSESDVSDRAALVIHNEVVAEAELGTYQGRLALKVL